MSTAAPVPSPHEFSDAAYVRQWNQENEANYAHRAQFFAAFAEELAALGPDLEVLELGSGAGALADHLLSNTSIERYHLVDISEPMHSMARDRLAPHGERTQFVLADFRTSAWTADLDVTADAILTMQAIHELRHSDRVPELYRWLMPLIRPGGLLLACDHLRQPDDDSPLYMSVEQHVDAMTAAGLVDPRPVLVHPRMVLMRGRVGKTVTSRG